MHLPPGYNDYLPKILNPSLSNKITYALTRKPFPYAVVVCYSPLTIGRRPLVWVKLLIVRQVCSMRVCLCVRALADVCIRACVHVWAFVRVACLRVCACTRVCAFSCVLYMCIG